LSQRAIFGQIVRNVRAPMNNPRCWHGAVAVSISLAAVPTRASVANTCSGATTSSSRAASRNNPPAEPVEAARIERAWALARKHHCLFCHNSDFSGHDNVPRLAAQREDYLLKALREYKANTRPGYDASMAEVVQPLGDAELADLAYLIAHAR
jgi:cytochrome c553